LFRETLFPKPQAPIRVQAFICGFLPPFAPSAFQHVSQPPTVNKSSHKYHDNVPKVRMRKAPSRRLVHGRQKNSAQLPVVSRRSQSSVAGRGPPNRQPSTDNPRHEGNGAANKKVHKRNPSTRELSVISFVQMPRIRVYERNQTKWPLITECGSRPGFGNPALALGWRFGNHHPGGSL